MVTFTDKFDRADTAIETAVSGTVHWAALNSADNTANVVAILDGRAVNNAPAEEAVAWVVSERPETAAQHVEGMVNASVQGADCYVDIGVLGTEDQASWASTVYGVWVRFAWLANGARRVSLMRRLPGDSAVSTVAVVDLVYAGSIESDNFRGRLVEAGALGTPQHVRLIVTVVDGGLMARAYVNTDDNDAYILRAPLDGDYLGSGDATQPYGSWWIGFGAASGSAGDQSVLVFRGEDFDESEDKVLASIRVDQPTLAEIRQEVLIRYSGIGATSRDSRAVDDAIRHAVNDVVHRMGDQNDAVMAEETVTLTVNPATSRVTAGLHALMERIVEIRESVNETPIGFSWERTDTNGVPVIRIASWTGTQYIIRYRRRLIEPASDDDYIPVLKPHREPVILLACSRLAIFDGKFDVSDRMQLDAERALMRIFRDQQRTRMFGDQRMAIPLRGPMASRTGRSSFPRWNWT